MMLLLLVMSLRWDDIVVVGNITEMRWDDVDVDIEMRCCRCWERHCDDVCCVCTWGCNDQFGYP